MKKILSTRERIYDQFDNSKAGEAYFFKDENRCIYAAYYTSMYLLQDTGEAILEHMESGFSDNPLRAYLEFWGVMQATEIQQDAICEIYKAITGKALNSAELTAWHSLRDRRNLCAGHPANRDRGVPAPQRTFMGRDFGNYQNISYELFNENTKCITHPEFDLQKLINDYDNEASQVLKDVLTHMKKEWP